MFIRNGLVVLGLAVVALGGVAPAAIAQGTDRVSLDSAGTQGGDHSVDPSISDDGRYVAFGSAATNLVAGDTNGVRDVFVRDRDSGVTVRVSVASDGTQANDHNDAPALSADGRHVAFRSFATNLVAGDTNGRADVFVHDLDTGITERVSVGNTGAQSDRESDRPSISADGRYVAFESHATNLVASDTNGFNDVFVRDRVGATTVRVNVSSAGAEGNQFSGYPSISADGRVVSFQSNASNLVAGDTNGLGDIFVHDLDTAITIRVSLDSAGNQGDRCACDANEISADGRRIAFTSGSTNLVAGDTNNLTDAFVHDLDDETTVRASVSSAGSETVVAGAEEVSISADGRHVGFASRAPNLVAGDTNAATDVFVRDLDSATTERVSVDSAGNQGNGFAGRPSLSADGRYVAFDASSSNLVAGDTNAVFDVFVRDVGADVSASLPAVVRSSTGWLLRDSATTGPPTATFSYGLRPLVALMGDWDGNGSRTAGTFEGGRFKLRNSNSEGTPDITFAFGDRRGFPVAGDFDGDGTDDVAVFRAGLWQVRLNTEETWSFAYGSGTWPATVPVTGDWDGDGSDGIGTYAYGSATWSLRNSADAGAPDAGSFMFGTPGSSYPVPADFDGDGVDSVAVKTGVTWTARESNSAGAADLTFDFGEANDLPLTWRNP